MVSTSNTRTVDAGLTPQMPVGTSAHGLYHPDFQQRIRVTAIEQPANEDAVCAQTIRYMSAFAVADAVSPAVRSATAEAVQGRYTTADQIAGIFEWVKSHVRFVQDTRFTGAFRWNPANVEVLIRPVDLLGMPEPKEDCDGFSMLTASMLTAAGITAAFRTIAADPEAPRSFSHVYVVARADGHETPLDTSHGPGPGWEHRPAYRSHTWELSTMINSAGRPLGDTAPWWQTISTTIAEKIATPILVGRYSNPTPQAGTYIRNADGSVIYGQQPGAAALQFPSSEGNTTALVIGGVVVLGLFAVVLMKGKS